MRQSELSTSGRTAHDLRAAMRSEEDTHSTQEPSSMKSVRRTQSLRSKGEGTAAGEKQVWGRA